MCVHTHTHKHICSMSNIYPYTWACVCIHIYIQHITYIYSTSHLFSYTHVCVHIHIHMYSTSDYTHILICTCVRTYQHIQHVRFRGSSRCSRYKFSKLSSILKLLYQMTAELIVWEILPDAGLPVIALVERGGCFFSDKMHNARDAGDLYMCISM